MAGSTLSRRGFLQVSGTAGGGMLLGFSLWGCKGDEKKSAKPAPAKPTSTKPTPTPATGPAIALGAWMEIRSDNKVHFFIPDAEMGQGVLTSVPMILADELGARWQDVSSAHAPYNPVFGRQSTGGSTTIRTGVHNFRTVAATARELLIGAAAARWKIEPGQCEARDGAVHRKDGKGQLTFGALAAEAAKRTPPDKPTLRPDSELHLIGKPTKRLDTPLKVDGSAVFGMDVRVPGMLTATIAHCPVFGGQTASFDATKAKAVPGVRHVIQIPTGVAVVADNFWAAKKGRDALVVKWTEGTHAQLSDAAIIEMCKKSLRKPISARKQGDARKAVAGATKKLRAVYHVPYLAHMPMEPLNCTAHVEKDKCTLWAATQTVTGVVGAAAEITGLPKDKITVHATFMGGGFGRRSQTDFVKDAVHVSKALGKPVKVVWLREDDVQGGFYRPMAYNELSGALDDKGWPSAWIHEIASPSILESFRPLRNGIDGTSVEGAANLPYAIANLEVTYANPKLPVSLWFWRSVGSSQNAFVTECFLDELAKAGGKDPVELRRRLLAKEPRHLRVLDKVATASGWGTPLPAGHARGVAVHKSFGSYVAQVAEVSLEGKKVRVHRVVCAVDCGKVINPDTIRAQVESGIVYGLSAALYGQVRIDKGRAVESNFHDYKVVRMAEMPRVETHIVTNNDPIGGIGEVATPPIAPAVCNAIFALTGKPVRSLPIKLG